MRKPLSVSVLIVLLALGTGSLGLGACSTAQGFGQDVEDTGEYIEDKAEDASD
jgi:predicted small secreted protein